MLRDNKWFKLALWTIMLLFLCYLTSSSQFTPPRKAKILANTIQSSDISVLVEFYAWYDSKDPYKHTEAAKIVTAMLDKKNTYPLVFNWRHRTVFVFEEVSGYVRFMDSTDYVASGEQSFLCSFSRRTSFRYK